MSLEKTVEEKTDLIEKVIDKYMSDLVKDYMGNPDGIPKEKIQEQLKKLIKLRLIWIGLLKKNSRT